MVVLSLWGQNVDTNGILGMVKYAAARSGRKYVFGREGWKGMVVHKQMYGCETLAWYQKECDEIRQNGTGRWLWYVEIVRNELIRGESGWSTIEEREAKVMVEWMLRVVFEDNLMFGKTCLVETGCKSSWWTGCRHICNKFGLMGLVNLILLRYECEWNGETRDECG